MLIVFYILSNTTVPNFVSVFEQVPNECKETIHRMPSAPSTIDTVVEQSVTSLPVQEIFRRAGNWLRGDVANDSGIDDPFLKTIFNVFVILHR